MLRIIAPGMFLLVGSLTAVAQTPPATTAPTTTPPATTPPAAAAPDPNSVEAALKQYVATFNQHDPAALAALWTPEGLYVDKATGQRTEGREALAADFSELFAASPAVVLSGQVEGIRPLSPDVAMVDGTSITATPDDEPSASTYSAIFKRVDGKWLIDSVHESPVPTPESPRQALEPLAWMVGHWQDQGDAGVVDTIARWSPSESFLIRSYTVQREDEPAFEGSQVIGWDPRAKQIRSWTFNSDGSFGEGMWSRHQDEWLVRTSQTLANGSAVTATQVITQVDADTATVQTISKETDGALEPASEPITIVRVADEPAAAPAESAVEPAAESTTATATTQVQP